MIIDFLFFLFLFCFFFKQKTAYDVRISDWSSDVCSSDLDRRGSASSETIGPAAVKGCNIFSGKTFSPCIRCARRQGYLGAWAAHVTAPGRTTNNSQTR